MDRATPETTTTAKVATTTTNVATTTTTTTTTPTTTFDEEWEEWDGNSPFWVHCVAGSMAGVAEHVFVYPLDTVRTHIQVCAACNFNPNTHNASTRAASMAAESVPGAILKQAAAAGTPKVSKTTTAVSSSTTSNNNMRMPKMGPSSAATTTTTRPNSGITSNLSMLQAVRQLVSQQPLALETTTTAATTTTTTTTTLNNLKNVASNSVKVESTDMTRLWRGVQTILV
eukprot:CAMPEP_0116140914 /NCGR_PEP_ID=MMETSP0329-20121206/14108_1 /TAXON_ID=697910 /ORGANISM="Pseudo-nitzschia arenysensis, Strain B593" /LENGTH=227 /DNA_ID=CAMNT_0003636073 /DNA_START=47 /DNA_END=727 /DNA_ORIENTATION=+